MFSKFNMKEEGLNYDNNTMYNSSDIMRNNLSNSIQILRQFK